VTVGAQNHELGTAALWGRLYATDAALLDRRLAAKREQLLAANAAMVAKKAKTGP
jgi:hypothetical protein